MRLIAALFAAGAVAASAAAACSSAPERTGATGGPTSSSTGTGGGSGDVSESTGGGGAGGSEERCPSLGDPCSTCLSSQCQESYCRCQRNVECAAAANCVLGCAEDDGTCRLACLSAHGPGVSALLLANGCSVEKCSVQCPGGRPLSACETCQFLECPSETNACVVEPACQTMFDCIEACGGDATCEAYCLTGDDDAAAQARAVFTCRRSRCSADCD